MQPVTTNLLYFTLIRWFLHTNNSGFTVLSLYTVRATTLYVVRVTIVLRSAVCLEPLP